MDDKKRRHFDLAHIEIFIRGKGYPDTVTTWGEKSNFKRACKHFSIKDGQFMYKEKRLVIIEKLKQLEIIKDVHEGIGESGHSKAMSSHYGRNSTYTKIKNRFFWNRIYDDVADFIKYCELCQKQADLKVNTKTELHNLYADMDVSLFK